MTVRWKPKSTFEAIISKANGLDKLRLENDAKHLGLEIEGLMKDVSHFEHGRS